MSLGRMLDGYIVVGKEKEDTGIPLIDITMKTTMKDCILRPVFDIQ